MKQLKQGTGRKPKTPKPNIRPPAQRRSATKLLKRIDEEIKKAINIAEEQMTIADKADDQETVAYWTGKLVAWSTLRRILDDYMEGGTFDDD